MIMALKSRAWIRSPFLRVLTLRNLLYQLTAQHGRCHGLCQSPFPKGFVCFLKPTLTSRDLRIAIIRIPIKLAQTQNGIPNKPMSALKSICLVRLSTNRCILIKGNVLHGDIYPTVSKNPAIFLEIWSLFLLKQYMNTGLFVDVFNVFAMQCSMWGISFWPGIEHAPPTLEAQSQPLDREGTPCIYFFRSFIVL